MCSDPGSYPEYQNRKVTASFWQILGQIGCEFVTALCSEESDKQTENKITISTDGAGRYAPGPCQKTEIQETTQNTNLTDAVWMAH